MHKLLNAGVSVAPAWAKLFSAQPEHWKTNFDLPYANSAVLTILWVATLMGFACCCCLHRWTRCSTGALTRHSVYCQLFSTFAHIISQMHKGATAHGKDSYSNSWLDKSSVRHSGQSHWLNCLYTSHRQSFQSVCRITSDMSHGEILFSQQEAFSTWFAKTPPSTDKTLATADYWWRRFPSIPFLDLKGCLHRSRLFHI